jgi:hypothetical protein
MREFSPHRMEAALSYARRYALFALVGIAGEDDLDAPDLLVEPSPAINVPRNQNGKDLGPRKRPSGSIHKPSLPIRSPDASADLRDRLIEEIEGIQDANDLAVWTQGGLVAKNTLKAEDAEAVELAYSRSLKHPNDLDDLSSSDEKSSILLPNPKSGEGATALDELTDQRGDGTKQKGHALTEVDRASKQRPSSICRGPALPCLPTFSV